MAQRRERRVLAAVQTKFHFGLDGLPDAAGDHPLAHFHQIHPFQRRQGARLVRAGKGEELGEQALQPVARLVDFLKRFA